MMTALGGISLLKALVPSGEQAKSATTAQMADKTLSM
jgi:hypothetical protein